MVLYVHQAINAFVYCICLFWKKNPTKQKRQTAFLKDTVIPYFYFLCSGSFSVIVSAEEFYFCFVRLLTEAVKAK